MTAKKNQPLQNGRAKVSVGRGRGNRGRRIAHTCAVLCVIFACNNTEQPSKYRHSHA